MKTLLLTLPYALVLLVTLSCIPETATASEREERLEKLRDQALHSIENPSKPERFYIKPLERKERIQIERTKMQEHIDQIHEVQETQEKFETRFDYKQQIAIRAIDSLVQHAELLSERVGDFAVIHEDIKAAIEAEIEADIATLHEFKTRAQTAESEEQLQQVADLVKDYRKNANAKTIQKLMLLAHVGVYEHRILETATARADTIAEKLTEFTNAQKQTEELKELLTQAENSITEASVDLQALRQYITESDMDKTTMEEMRDSLKHIQEKIRHAYSLFRQIAKEAAEL